MFDRPVAGNRALLVHIDTRRSVRPADRPAVDLQAARDEFVELARSAGLQVTNLIIGSRSRPDPRHFIGSGKIEEIRLSMAEHEVDVVLFGQRLTPSQERNLESELEVRVLDRNSLILDIFAQRARSFEGKLQVELAQLTHLSTRLVRGWTHLERQKGGIGLRGPGETQLETDRRLLADRVKMLKRRLLKVRRQRDQGRSQRTKSGIPTVALVGYTNAGKSTLFNALTSEGVYVADQLFATLDPTLRKLALPGGNSVVLADTVGFISDLPHALVDAFLSTLTETREADLLLHVIDISDDQHDARRSDVDDVLNSIGAGSVPQLAVFNKIDRTGHQARVDLSEAGEAETIWLSAVSGDGIDTLLEAIAVRTNRARTLGWLRVGPEQGRLRSQLYAIDGIVEEQMETDGSFLLHIDVDVIDFTRLDREHHMKSQFEPEPPLAAPGKA